MASAFGNAIEFLGRLGLYDVILPFLLTFTIIYAILDKTRILGTDEFDKVKYPKKNLNALVAFCIGFLVIASKSLVALINTTLAQIVVLFMICVFYLALVGIFFKDNVEEQYNKGPWKNFFMVVLLIAIVLIFANGIKLESGESVLEFIYNQLAFNIDSAAVSAIVLIILIIGAMFYVVTPSKSGGEKKDGGDKK